MREEEGEGWGYLIHNFNNTNFNTLMPCMQKRLDKVHSFCKQCLHKYLVFLNRQLMSALASLERFGEDDPFFHKVKIVQTLFTK